MCCFVVVFAVVGRINVVFYKNNSFKERGHSHVHPKDDSA